MNKQKNQSHPSNEESSQTQHKGLGNPDDHEPTNEVKKENINP